jgi:hypothetical protein
MSTKKSTKENTRRSEQLEQLKEAADNLNSLLKLSKENHKKLILLDSVSEGLYEEVDKLAKKAPAEPLTDLALEQVNDVIRETKQLIETDSYVQRLKEFVPAGDNPQHRDAVVVLRQIRQGLDRYRNELDLKIKKLNSFIQDMCGIQVAIEMYLEFDDDSVSKDDLKENGVDVSADWLIGNYSERTFNFEKLDRIDIKDYFSEAHLS